MLCAIKTLAQASSASDLYISATATLVQAFVANRLDYCSSLCAGLPACRLGCLDRVLRSAARQIGGYLNLAMSLHICLMFYAGSLLSSGFHIGLLPWSGVAYLALLLFTFVSSVVLSIVL